MFRFAVGSVLVPARSGRDGADEEDGASQIEKAEMLKAEKRKIPAGWRRLTLLGGGSGAGEDRRRLPPREVGWGWFQTQGGPPGSPCAFYAVSPKLFKGVLRGFGRWFINNLRVRLSGGAPLRWLLKI